MGATHTAPKPDERSKPSIIGRTVIIGFGLATGLGIYLAAQFGWIIGILGGWIGGNALALGLAYAWFQIDRSRQARAERNETQETFRNRDRGA